MDEYESPNTAVCPPPPTPILICSMGGFVDMSICRCRHVVPVGRSINDVYQSAGRSSRRSAPGSLDGKPVGYDCRNLKHSPITPVCLPISLNPCGPAHLWCPSVVAEA